MADPTLFDEFDTVTPHPVRRPDPPMVCSTCGGKLVATGLTGPHEYRYVHDGPVPRHCGTSSPEPRVLGSDAAVAIGRFNPEGVEGYRASTLPDAPLRATRAEATDDEARHRAGPISHNSRTTEETS